MRAIQASKQRAEVRRAPDAPRQLQDRLGVRRREAPVGGGAPVEPGVAQVLARRRAHRRVARHAQAEDVLGVAGHAGSIAMLPLRIDVVDVGELPVDQRGRAASPASRSRCRSPRRPRGRRSRPAIPAGVSFEPVTLCQKPGASARSSSSTSSAAVWMTTRTDSGILKPWGRHSRMISHGCPPAGCLGHESPSRASAGGRELDSRLSSPSPRACRNVTNRSILMKMRRSPVRKSSSSKRKVAGRPRIRST